MKVENQYRTRVFGLFLFAVGCPLGCGVEADPKQDIGVSSENSAISSPWYRTRGTNTQALFGDNIYFADLDGDEVTELLQYSDNKVFVRKSNYAQTGLFHQYFPLSIQRLFTGDFFERGYDQVCFTREDGYLFCYQRNADGSGLAWITSQSNFIQANEEIIVGDYDGDERDDLLLYNKITGQIRFYSVTVNTVVFSQKANMTLGNLQTAAVPNMQLRAAEVTGDSRMDILAVNSYGQVLRFDSVNSNGEDTFWWAFTTNSGVAASTDQVTIARVDNNMYDDIVLHNKSTGVNRFFKAQYDNGNLKAITSVQQGQLGVKSNSRLYWGRLHGNLIEPGAILRDDAIVYVPGNRMMYRYDARWDSTASDFTYWWDNSQPAPENHTGWASISEKPWLILKCRFKNGSTTWPHTHAWLSDLFLHADEEGLQDFWRDVTYGSWKTTGSTMPTTWFPIDLTFTQAQALSRDAIIQKCVDASQLSTSGYFNVVTLYNENIGAGAPWLGGRVLLDPTCLDGACAGHEMGHGFGWMHSYDNSGRLAVNTPEWVSQPGEYYDRWDIMSGVDLLTFSNTNSITMGPELVSPMRRQKNLIPAQRITTLVPGSTTKTAILDIAALNRPEANGSLLVAVGSSTSNYFSVEFRQSRGFDQGIGTDAVLVHQVIGGNPYLITQGSPYTKIGTELTTGEIKTLSDGTKITINSIDATAGIANVKIEY